MQCLVGMKTIKQAAKIARRIRIKALKRRYGSLYGKIMNYENYNCGHAMQLAIDSRYYKMCKEFNRVADQLAALDPNCPEFRYNLNP